MDFKNLFELPALFYFTAKFSVGFLFSKKKIFIGQIAYPIALSIFNEFQLSRTSVIQVFFWKLWGYLLELGFYFIFLVSLKFTITATKAFSPSFYLIWMQMKSIYLENSYFTFCNLESALEHNALFLCRRVYFLYFFSIQGLIQPSVLFRLWKSSK